MKYKYSVWAELTKAGSS